MAVVKTPESVPAAKSCGYLRNRKKAVDTCGKKKKRTEGNNRQQQSSHLRKDIVGTFLLQFLAESESKETDGKHGCDPNDGGCHASVKSCHAL